MQTHTIVWECHWSWLFNCQEQHSIKLNWHSEGESPDWFFCFCTPTVFDLRPTTTGFFRSQKKTTKIETRKENAAGVKNWNNSNRNSHTHSFQIRIRSQSGRLGGRASGRDVSKSVKAEAKPLVKFERLISF